jgi:hypothetical protein
LRKINSVVDLKARSMCDNLLSFIIHGNENTTDIIYKLLVETMEMEDAARKVKIDGSHWLGKPQGSGKGQPIVVKFNFRQDK